MHRLFGLAQGGGAFGAPPAMLLQPRRAAGQRLLELRQAQPVGRGMGAGLGPGAIDLFALALELRAGLARMLDGLLGGADLAAGTVELGLHRAHAFAGLELVGADRFDFGLDPAQRGERRLERGLALPEGGVTRADVGVERPPAQAGQLDA